MKRFLKFAVITTILLVALVMTAYMYWNREQQIDFTSKLPIELTHCGRTITPSNDEYTQLKTWLNSHQFGWKNAGPVTYATKIEYLAKNISINVLSFAVVVNYKTEDGNWNQMIHNKNVTELSKQCVKK